MFYYAGKNGNGDSSYIPNILKFSGYQANQFSKKSNEQIIINYTYTNGIITLKFNKLYSSAFAAQFDACIIDFLVTFIYETKIRICSY